MKEKLSKLWKIRGFRWFTVAFALGCFAPTIFSYGLSFFSSYLFGVPNITIVTNSFVDLGNGSTGVVSLSPAASQIFIVLFSGICTGFLGDVVALLTKRKHKN